MKSMKVKGILAAFGLALCAAAAFSPAQAASPDNGIVFDNVNLTLSNSANATLPYVSPGGIYSLSATGSYSSPQSGSFGDVTYGSVFLFDVSGLIGASSAGPGGGNLYDQASLTLNYKSIAGTPVLSLISTTYNGYFPEPVGAAGILGQNFTLAPSAGPGSVTLSLGPTYAASLQSNLFYGNSAGSFLHVIANAGGGAGSGVPGPIAGAGLPVLAAACLALMRRRRQARGA